MERFGRVCSLLAAAALMAALAAPACADEPDAALVEVGSVAASPGERVAVPIRLTPGDRRVASVDLTVWFDDSVLSFDGSEEGEALLETGKLAFVELLGQGAVAVLVTGTLEELDDGRLITLFFVLDTAAAPGSVIALEAGSVSAASPLASAVPVNISSGSIQVESCARPAPPAWVEATQGRFADRVVVEWSQAPGASTYTVYRGETADPNSAAPIASGVTGTRFVDRRLGFDDGNDGFGPPTATGCAGAVKALARQGSLGYRYWVVAENACGESDAAGPAAGWAGAGADRRADVRADGAALGLATLALATWARVRSRRLRRR